MNIMETERLLIKKLCPEDAPFIIDLVNSPGWLAYIGDRNIKTVDKAEKYLIGGPIESYSENGFGLWLVLLKEGNTKIGMCGLLKRNYLSHPDLGFAFLPEFMGKGYAVESALSVITYANEQLGIRQILAIVMPQNHRSIRLLEKIGMNFKDTIEVPPDKEVLSLYEIINQ